MGDVVMLAHALRALKEAYPDLRVTVATRPVFRAFFTGLDLGFMDVDIKGVHHSLRGMWRLAADARRLGVDAVADVHGVLRSVTFRTALRLHGIPFAAIGKGRDEKGEFIRRGGRGVKPAKHTVVRYCDVFRKLGFVFDDPKPAVRREHPSPMGEKTGTWIGFAPFSAQQGKTYPEPLARETVRLLAGRYDRVFIHSGGGAEAEFAQEMERLHPNVTALFGRVKMAGEIDLIANLDCVVSMDSLVMHLASLVATPVVSVWGATHPGLGFFGYGCDPRGIVQAVIATVICLVIAFPIGYMLSRLAPPHQKMMQMLIMLPMWMNFLLRTYAWMTLLENNGLINRFLGLFGIGPLHMINTSGAVVLSMVYSYLPFMILPLYTIMVKIDQSVIEAAQDLGASQFHILSRVLVPLAMPGITTGITMVFMPAVSTFIISRLLGGGTQMMLGDLIEQQFLGGAYNPQLGAAIALVMMAIVVVCMLVMNRFGDGEEQAVML